MTLDGVIPTSIAGLALRELRPNDAETFYALVQKNRAHLTAWAISKRKWSRR